MSDEDADAGIEEVEDAGGAGSFSPESPGEHDEEPQTAEHAQLPRMCHEQATSPAGASHNEDDSPGAQRERSPSSDHQQHREHAASGQGGLTVCVRGMPFNVTPGTLIDKFGAYGAIKNLTIPSNPLTREGRGFAFIGYADAQCALDAIASLNGSEIGGQRVAVMESRRSRRKSGAHCEWMLI